MANEGIRYFDTVEAVLTDAREAHHVPAGEPVVVAWPDGPPDTIVLAFTMPDGEYSGRMTIQKDADGLTWTSWSMCLATNPPPRGVPSRPEHVRDLA